MHTRKLCFLVAALSLCLALTACDDDADPSPEPDGDTSTGDTTADADATQPDAEPDATTTPDAEPDEDTIVPPDELRIPGLSGPVRAVYDEHGLLHLQCLTDDDCAAALGYFHAANRFFFMDFNRLNFRGQVGRYAPLDGALGQGLLAEDIARRRFMSTAQGEPLEEVMFGLLDDEEQRLLERYTDGVNTWLADVRAGRNGARLSPEYNLGLLYPGSAPDRAARIRDWEPADSMAVALSVFDELANSADEELFQGAAIARFSMLDLELASDLVAPRQAFDVDTMGASGVDFDALRPDAMERIRLDLVRERLVPAERLLDLGRLDLRGGLQARPGGGGSNNWVVAPGNTTDGNALLANDPHLALFNPSVWFPAELDSKTAPGASGSIKCAGGTFAGLPVFLIGHCEHIAWGVTTANWDLSDVYLETLNEDGTAVLFNGAEVPIVEREVTFWSNNQEVRRTLRWVPHHGPIISEDLGERTAVSVRWTLHDGSAAYDVAAFLGLMRAQDLAGARQALSGMHGANQSFVVVDDAGNIGWYPWVRLPRRSWDWLDAPPWLPLPGDGSAEWDATAFGPDELPSMENPPAGFIASANQDLTGALLDGDASDSGGLAQTFGKAPGVRMQRIVELLEAGGSQHSAQTMLAIQADTYSLLGETLVPAIVAAHTGATLSPQAQATLDALSNWQRTCPTGLDGTAPDAPPSSDATERAEAIGCTIFHVVLFETLAGTFGDEAIAAGVDGLLGGSDAAGVWLRTTVRLLVELLERPLVLAAPAESYWDDRTTTDAVETRDEVLRAAFQRAYARLSAPRVVPEGEEPGLGEDLEAWLWGRIHTVSLRSPYNSFQSDFTGFNDGPRANDGGLFTVDVANPEDRPGLDYHHRRGASIRMVVEMTPQGPVMQLQLPGGTSLDRQSGRYNQLFERWLRDEPVTMPFGVDNVSQPQATLEVLPAAE